MAAQVITAGLGRLNLHCKRFYSILFAFLNILYYFSVNLNSSYVYGAYGDAVNFLLPWGFQTASFSKQFRKLFNHLGKSYVAKKSCVYLLLGCKFVVQNIAVLGCNTAHKPPLKSSAKIKKKQPKNHIDSLHAVTRIQMNFCITRLGRNFRGFCGAV